MHKYKVSVFFQSDKKELIECIINKDKKATVANYAMLGTEFVVKTRMNYKELSTLLIKAGNNYSYGSPQVCSIKEKKGLFYL